MVGDEQGAKGINALVARGREEVDQTVDQCLHNGAVTFDSRLRHVHKVCQLEVIFPLP